MEDQSSAVVDPLQSCAPSAPESARFLVARARGGSWTVTDRLGVVGGVFANERAARHFAFEEAGGHLEQVTVIVNADAASDELRRAA